MKRITYLAVNNLGDGIKDFLDAIETMELQTGETKYMITIETENPTNDE